jgi:hypothetical protein
MYFVFYLCVSLNIVIIILLYVYIIKAFKHYPTRGFFFSIDVFKII